MGQAAQSQIGSWPQDYLRQASAQGEIERPALTRMGPASNGTTNNPGQPGGGGSAPGAQRGQYGGPGHYGLPCGSKGPAASQERKTPPALKLAGPVVRLPFGPTVLGRTRNGTAAGRTAARR